MRLPNSRHVALLFSGLLFCANRPIAALDLSGLAAWFRMDNTFTNEVGLPLALTNGATFVTDRSGNASHALGLTPGPWVGSASSDFLKGASNWTFSVWVRPSAESLAGFSALYSEGIPQLTLGILLNSGVPLLSSFDESAAPPVGPLTQLSANRPLQADVWQHLAFTFEATNAFLGTCHLYLGGTNIGSGSLGFQRLVTPELAAVHSFAFGQNVGRFTFPEQINLPFTGSLDDARIFTRTLSPAEVSELKDLDNPPPAQATVTITYKGPLSPAPASAPVGHFSVAPSNTVVLPALVTITASADPGYAFLRWSGATNSAANPLVLAPTNDLNLNGEFGIIAPGAADHATIAIEPAAPAYATNTVITLTALPDFGYEFLQWSDGNTNPSRSLVVERPGQVSALTKLADVGPAFPVLAGNPLPGFIDAPGSQARFNGIADLATDAAGNLFAADSGNRRIRRISPAGIVSTVAGSGATGLQDGAGTNATFTAPREIASAPDGSLFVLDGNRVRHIDTNGVVTTLVDLAGVVPKIIPDPATPRVGIVSLAGNTNRFAFLWFAAVDRFGLTVPNGANIYEGTLANGTWTVGLVASSPNAGAAFTSVTYGPDGRLIATWDAGIGNSVGAISALPGDTFSVLDALPGRLRFEETGPAVDRFALALDRTILLPRQHYDPPTLPRENSTIEDYSRLADFDVLRLDPKGAALQVYRRADPLRSVAAGSHGTLFATLPTNTHQVFLVRAPSTAPLANLTLGTAGGGLISASPGTLVPVGTSVTLTPVPSPGFQFIDWDASSALSGTPSSFVLTSNRNVGAVFGAPLAPLGINGSITRTPSQPIYPFGSTVALSFTPLPGHRFVAWSDGVTTTNRTVTVDAIVNLSALAEPIPVEHTLAIATEPPGHADWIQPIPAQASYTNGSILTLTALPPLGWGFLEWGGDISGTLNPHLLTLVSNATIVARFGARVTATLDHGSLSRTPDRDFYPIGSTVTFTATTPPGLDDVQWPDGTTGKSKTLTITGPLEIQAVAIPAVLAGGPGPGFQDGPGTTARFAGISDLAVSPAGILYAADPGNHRIRKIMPDGTVSTAAGSSDSGSDDGPAESARFLNPTEVEIDADGWIWVLDAGRIRRLSPSGTVTTLADLRTRVPSLGSDSIQATFLKSLAVHGTNRFSVIWAAWHSQVAFFLGSRVFEGSLGSDGTLSFREISDGLNAVALSYDPSGNLVALQEIDPVVAPNLRASRLTPSVQSFGEIPDTAARFLFDFYRTRWAAFSIFPSTPDGALHVVTPAATAPEETHRTLTHVYRKDGPVPAFDIWKQAPGFERFTVAPDGTLYVVPGSSNFLSFGTSIVRLQTALAPTLVEVLAATAGAGHVTFAPTNRVPHGTSITVTAIPDPGWEFVRWDGTTALQGNPTTLVATQNLSATAVFGATVSISAAHATITRSPDLPAYPSGSSVTIDVHPESGWEVTGWSDGGSGLQRTLTITAPVSLAVDTRPKSTRVQLLLAADPSEALPWLNVTPPGPDYTPVTEVTVHAQPITGYSFLGFSGVINTNVNGLTTNFTSTPILLDADKILVGRFGAILDTGADPLSVLRQPNLPAYPLGTVVLLTAIAPANSHFVRWSDSSTNNPRSLSIQGPLSLIPVFAPDPATGKVSLSVTISGQGQVNGAPPAPVDAGTPISLTAEPAPGWVFLRWDGLLDVTTNPVVVFNLPSSLSITSVFGATLTTASAHGTISRQPSSPAYPVGTDVTLTFSPDPGHRFDRWSDGHPSPTRTVKINTPLELTVATVPSVDAYTLSLIAVPPETAPSLAVFPQEPTHPPGTALTLVALTPEGWEFAGFRGDFVSPLLVANVTITSNMVVEAVFNARIQVSGAPATFSRSPEQSSYALGSKVTLTAIPPEGKRFVRWSDNLTSNPRVVTVERPLTIGPIFEDLVLIREFQVTITTQGGGSMSNAPTQPVREQSTLTVTALPSPGFSFMRWESSVPLEGNPLTLTVSNDLAINAVFGATIETKITNGIITRDPDLPLYPYGTSVQIVALPDPGYAFFIWSDLIFSPSRTAIVTSPISLEATTAKIIEIPRLRISTLPAGFRSNIQVTPDQTGYEPGSTVHLKANTPSGYQFFQWEGDAIGNNPEIDLVMTTTRQVVAHYAAAVDVSIEAGSIRREPDLPFYPVGSNVVLTVIPPAGSIFAKWSDGNVANPRVLTVLSNTVLRATSVTFIDATIRPGKADNGDVLLDIVETLAPHFEGSADLLNWSPINAVPELGAPAGYTRHRIANTEPRRFVRIAIPR